MPFRLDGSLLNLLDAVTVSHSTEVLYQIGRQAQQSRLCLL